MPFIRLYMASFTRRRLSVRHVSSLVVALVGPDARRQMSTLGDFGARGRVRLTADGDWDWEHADTLLV